MNGAGQRSSLSSLSLALAQLSASGSGSLRSTMGFHRPASSALSGDEALLGFGHVVLGEDGLDRALGHAQRAVDALVGIDHQEIGALAETVDRTDIHAVGVLALDTGFGHHVSHGRRSFAFTFG
jgi:hypothetical protein